MRFFIGQEGPSRQRPSSGGKNEKAAYTSDYFKNETENRKEGLAFLGSNCVDIIVSIIIVIDCFDVIRN